MVTAATVGMLEAFIDSGRIACARPKSRILTRPSDVRNTFSGLRSRWTIPRPCANASPSAIARAIAAA